MVRNEVEMTEEEHMLGKAIMGMIAIILTLLLFGFAMLGEMHKEVPIYYMDDITNLETKDIA
jgi:hypothetical protein